MIEFNVYKIVYAILLFIFRLNKIYLEQILKMTYIYLKKKWGWSYKLRCVFWIYLQVSKSHPILPFDLFSLIWKRHNLVWMRVQDWFLLFVAQAEYWCNTNRFTDIWHILNLVWDSLNDRKFSPSESGRERIMLQMHVVHNPHILLDTKLYFCVKFYSNRYKDTK